MKKYYLDTKYFTPEILESLKSCLTSTVINADIEELNQYFDTDIKDTIVHTDFGMLHLCEEKTDEIKLSFSTYVLGMCDSESTLLDCNDDVYYIYDKYGKRKDFEGEAEVPNYFIKYDINFTDELKEAIFSKLSYGMNIDILKTFFDNGVHSTMYFIFDNKIGLCIVLGNYYNSLLEELQVDGTEVYCDGLDLKTNDGNLVYTFNK